MHLALGGYSLHTIIYSGTSHQKKNETQHGFQTHQNKLSTDNSTNHTDITTQSGGKMGYITHQNKTIFNDTAEHNNDINKVDTNFSIAQPEKKIYQEES